MSILVKLGPDNSIFVSTFHATKKTLGTTWNMSFFYDFSIVLTKEQGKLVKMGALKK
jgi:hypothetical protein